MAHKRVPADDDIGFDAAANGDLLAPVVQRGITIDDGLWNRFMSRGGPMRREAFAAMRHRFDNFVTTFAHQPGRQSGDPEELLALPGRSCRRGQQGLVGDQPL